MKQKIEKATLGLLAKVARATAEREVNSACFLFAYQPEIPRKLENMKKHSK